MLHIPQMVVVVVVVVVVVIYINFHNQVRGHDKLQSLWVGRIPQGKNETNPRVVYGYTLAVNSTAVAPHPLFVCYYEYTAVPPYQTRKYKFQPDLSTTG